MDERNAMHRCRTRYADCNTVAQSRFDAKRSHGLWLDPEREPGAKVFDSFGRCSRRGRIVSRISSGGFAEESESGWGLGIFSWKAILAGADYLCDAGAARDRGG